MFVLILQPKQWFIPTLDKSHQEILYRIDNWINGWVSESIDAAYVNISVVSPLSGNIYIALPCGLKNSMKALINIKNNDIKWFLWCHMRHLTSLKIHPERITKVDKNMVNDLDYKGIEFPVSKKDCNEIEKKNNICINVFCYENNMVCPAYVLNGKFENCMNLLIITDKSRLHYVYIKDFKTKNKNKKHLQVLFTVF